jgi:hypothetical protein
MTIIIILMGVAATVWLSYETWRLLFQLQPLGAIDLRMRLEESQLWFGGVNVYEQSIIATYPPASFLLLWPFIGWTTLGFARWFWAATTVLSLFWLLRIFLEESQAGNNTERWLVLLCPLAAYATGATIGNGQLAIHLLPCLVTAILITARGRERLSDDLVVAALFLFALVKPSVTAPFFWILLFAPGRIRPAALVVLGYLGLTIWACAFQQQGIIYMMQDWLSNSTNILSGSGFHNSNASIHSLLAGLGLGTSVPFVSTILLAGLGVWIYRFRRVDPWLLMGVAALISRFYTYHGWYDDVLIFLPMIAVFRQVKIGGMTSTSQVIAVTLLLAGLVFMIAPGGLYLLPQPWSQLYTQIQVGIWILILGFLGHRTWKMDQSGKTGNGNEGPPVA